MLYYAGRHFVQRVAAHAITKMSGCVGETNYNCCYNVCIKKRTETSLHKSFRKKKPDVVMSQ